MFHLGTRQDVSSSLVSDRFIPGEKIPVTRKHEAGWASERSERMEEISLSGFGRQTTNLLTLSP
jgi:hypothetical protein